MPLPARFARLDREPSREIIYRQLKALILDLTLQPLEVLRDTDLAQRLGVSRTPVREALRKLEDEGFIESHRNQWTRVTAIEARYLLQIYPVAQALHVTALRMAFDRLDQEDIEHMREMNESMTRAVTQGSAAEALRCDAAFHRVIVDRAENPVLSQFVAVLTERLQRLELAHFSKMESGSASASEHRALIRAIRAKNLRDAVCHMTTNWECPVIEGIGIEMRRNA